VGSRRLDGGPSYDGSDVLSPLAPPHMDQGMGIGQGGMNRAQSTSALPEGMGKGKKLGASASAAALSGGGKPGRRAPAASSVRLAHKAHEEETIRAALRSGHSRGASRGGIVDANAFAVDTLVPAAGQSKGGKKGGFGGAQGSAEAYLHQLQDLEEGRSDLELKLEQYIGHVFNRVLERKAKHSAQVAGRSKRQVTSTSQSITGSQLDGGADQVSVTASQILSDTAHDPSGLTGLGLHYFTESDRFQCMCLLLSDPTVFSQVVEEMQKRLYY
jgi:hypothetical protein